MGKNSKTRRDARAKAARASRRRRDRQQPADPFGFTATGHRPPPPPDPAQVWLALASAGARGALPSADVLEQIARDPERADRGAEKALFEQLQAVWQRGWQPREIRREVRRATTARAARLIEMVIHADHDRRPGQSLDPAWAAQVNELGHRDASTRGAWLAGWRTRERIDFIDAAMVVGQVLSTLMFAPTLDELIPPPGVSSDRSRGRLGDLGPVGGDSDPMLNRIRKLLAKAESTEFEAEAEMLSAKAQELMTRHAIDLAAVAAPHDDHSPRMIRIPVDAPYADAKSYLLQVVAGASRARSIYNPRVLMSSVVGHPSDLVGVELLFTSLLVQAQSAMASPMGATRPGSRARSQSYRSAFLLSFAQRIGERLQSTNERVFADSAAMAADYLPVLRAREEAVDDFIDQHYGELSSGRVRGGYDPAGWAHGHAAADQAKLDSGQISP